MARPKKERKERLSIYLAKDPSCLSSSLLKLEKTKTPIELSVEGADSALLYIKIEPPKHSPPWTKFFTSRREVPGDAFGDSSTVGAALIISMLDSKFVLTFGSGFHLLQNEQIERDFGLRVTLNSVDPDKLRSLDKASYDHNPLNSRTQSSREVDIFDLHIDSETEMLYAVTGVSTVDVFGSHVTGRDALTLVVSVDMDGLVAILTEAIVRYKKKLPEKFEWVDNVYRIRDAETNQVLDLELDDYLKAGKTAGFWVGEPEVVDWESQVGYSFDMYSNTPRHVVLDMDDLFCHIAGKGLTLTADSLRLTTVHVNDSEYRDVKSWSAYRCLYAELTVGGEYYILRNGIWYRVDQNFVNKIDNYFVDLQPYGHTMPKYIHDSEGEYNDYVASIDGSYLKMDKKNVRVGGAYDKIEFCDLVKDVNDLIHVKYYRSSSTLSHLFAQGCVAAEVFVRDVEFREKLNGKLPAILRLVDSKTMPDARKFKIVYAIATNKDIPKELPFFSKVTLKNSLRTLRALGYTVELCKIEVDPTVHMKKKIKPKK
ncbi:TIGR04141 family sporadically distributed protein [Pseudomonas sp. PDM13]|uniref:TIGR04141 family sporadically distributed protein n=1 Tax=Pseudomonas sp. PDM13 TaxID=2769255 RepID=UPI0021DFD3B4|nr:TIGR04141 family sporadically distributed protein [Pseudomonas sp. PDM13]MCU9951557.1 TIGR04141 family sporadically distributed protein [Pseudomonas sp. PDM13]